MTPTFKVSSGYDSDTSLTIRKRQSLSPLSLAEQKLAYKKVQKGGDVPINGLRKPAPERPKDILQAQCSPTLTRICAHQKRATRPPSSSSFSSMVTSRCTRSLSSLSTTRPRFQSPRCTNAKVDSAIPGRLAPKTSNNLPSTSSKSINAPRVTAKGNKNPSKPLSAVEKRSQSKKISNISSIQERCVAASNSTEARRDKHGAPGSTGVVSRRRRINCGTQKLLRGHNHFQEAREDSRPCFHTFVSSRNKVAANLSCPRCSQSSNKKQSLNYSNVKSKYGENSVAQSSSKRCRDRNQVEMKSNQNERQFCCKGSLRHASFQIDACEISDVSKGDAKLMRKTDRSYKILAKSTTDFPACVSIKKAMKNSEETNTKKFLIEILHAGAVVKDCTSLHVAKSNSDAKKNSFDSSKSLVAVSVNCHKIKRKPHEFVTKKNHYFVPETYRASSILDKTISGKECPLKSLINGELVRKKKCKGKVEDIIAMPVQIPDSIHVKRFGRIQRSDDSRHVCIAKGEFRNLENGIKKKRNKRTHAIQSNANDGLHRAYEIFLNNSDFNEICLYQKHTSKMIRPIDLCHVPKKSFVYERVVRHHEKMKESLKYKPVHKSCSMYLAYKQPVSKSIFKSRKFENTSTNSKETRHESSSVSSQVSRIGIQDRNKLGVHGQSSSRYSVSTSINKWDEQKLPCTSRKQVQRTRASKQRQDVCDSVVLSKKETGKLENVTTGAEEARDKNILLDEPTTSKNKTIAHYPQSMNRKYYMLDLASYQKKLSEKFHDLYDFYTTLESMNELRTMTRGRDENVSKKMKLREKVEDELDSLYTKLKSFQKDKNFLFATKDVDKLRWKGDCSLRCKRQSVENMLHYFRGLENEERSKQIEFKKDTGYNKSLRRGHSMYNITNTVKVRAENDAKNLEASRRLDDEKKSWRSLSVEQVTALKSQLETIYGNKYPDKKKPLGLSVCSKEKSAISTGTLRNDTKMRTDYDTSNYEVVVPSQFGDDVQDSQSSLYVRCHSMTTSDDFKKSTSHLDHLEKKLILKKSDSISYGGKNVENIELENIPCPITYGFDKKRLSLSSAKDVDVNDSAQLSLSLPSREMDLQRSVDLASVRSPDPERITVDDLSKNFYSLEVFYDENAKSQEQGTLLLGVKRDNEETQSFHSDWQEESRGQITTSHARDFSNKGTIGTRIWNKMISHNPPHDYVPKKIEFFEKKEKETENEDEPKYPKSDFSTSRSKMRKSLHSQSYSDLKDLFGETRIPRYTSFHFSDHGASPVSLEEISTRRRGSDDVSRTIGDSPPKWMYSWPRNEYEGTYRETRSEFDERSLSFCGCEQNSGKCLRDYFKFVNNGTVRRLRDYFECTGRICDNNGSLAPKRYRSNPELARSTKDFGVYENSTGHNVSFVSYARLTNDSNELMANVINTIAELKTTISPK